MAQTGTRLVVLLLLTQHQLRPIILLVLETSGGTQLITN